MDFGVLNLLYSYVILALGLNEANIMEGHSLHVCLHAEMPRTVQMSLSSKTTMADSQRECTPN